MSAIPLHRNSLGSIWKEVQCISVPYGTAVPYNLRNYT